MIWIFISVKQYSCSHSHRFRCENEKLFLSAAPRKKREKSSSFTLNFSLRNFSPTGGIFNSKRIPCAVVAHICSLSEEKEKKSYKAWWLCLLASKAAEWGALYKEKKNHWWVAGNRSLVKIRLMKNLSKNKKNCFSSETFLLIIANTTAWKKQKTFLCSLIVH